MKFFTILGIWMYIKDESDDGWIERGGACDVDEKGVRAYILKKGFWWFLKRMYKEDLANIYMLMGDDANQLYSYDSFNRIVSEIK